MGQPNQRQFERIKITRQNASVTTVGSRKKVDCMLVDVSAHGLGLISVQNILPDTQVIFNVAGQDIYLTLQWCQVLERHRTGYRYGFRVAESRINLAELLIARGYLDLKVLLVDDDPDITELYATMLGECGFGVEVARSGNEAIAIMDRQRFDVVLSDMVMVNGTGAAVVHEARDQRVPVAVLTGNPDACTGALPEDVVVMEKSGLSLQQIPSLIAALYSKEEERKAHRQD